MSNLKGESNTSRYFSSTRWPPMPNFYSQMTRKSQCFQTNAGHSGFVLDSIQFFQCTALQLFFRNHFQSTFSIQPNNSNSFTFLQCHQTDCKTTPTCITPFPMHAQTYSPVFALHTLLLILVHLSLCMDISDKFKIATITIDEAMI